MTKYYRVKEDNFLWLKGAILSDECDSDGYKPVDELWDATEVNGNEYISRRIIEAPENEKYFERVYVVSKGKRVVYMVKEKAREAAAKYYEGEK